MRDARPLDDHGIVKQDGRLGEFAEEADAPAERVVDPPSHDEGPGLLDDSPHILGAVWRHARHHVVARPGIYWLAASIGVKAGQTRWTRFAAVRVGVILVILLLLRVTGLKRQALTADPWLQGIGLAFFLLGLALAIWARMRLGRNWGMPMSEKADPELVTTGPYSRIRHPIYSSTILAMIGTTIVASLYWLAAVVLLGGYFLYSAIVEEGLMTRVFPEAYPEYKRSTKRLIPFIF